VYTRFFVSFVTRNVCTSAKVVALPSARFVTFTSLPTGGCGGVVLPPGPRPPPGGNCPRWSASSPGMFGATGGGGAAASMVVTSTPAPSPTMLKLRTFSIRFTICPVVTSITARAAFGISSGFFLSARALSISALVGVSGKYKNLESGVNVGLPVGPRGVGLLPPVGGVVGGAGCWSSASSSSPPVGGPPNGVARAPVATFVSPPVATFFSTISPSAFGTLRVNTTYFPSGESVTPLAVFQMSWSAWVSTFFLGGSAAKLTAAKASSSPHAANRGTVALRAR
jgi:hypothetical protein